MATLAAGALLVGVARLVYLCKQRLSLVGVKGALLDACYLILLGHVLSSRQAPWGTAGPPLPVAALNGHAASMRKRDRLVASVSLRELHTVVARVRPVLGEKLLVRATLGDLAVLHGHDLVGVLDGGEAVRDDQRRPALRKLG